jgi:hypothetical protein
MRPESAEREDDPAVIDPMTLLLADRTGRQRSGIGGVVRDLCEAHRCRGGELALLEAHRAACPADPIPVDVVALLAWVRHVEGQTVSTAEGPPARMRCTRRRLRR